jgi:hypothetical protein
LAHYLLRAFRVLGPFGDHPDTSGQAAAAPLERVPGGSLRML